MVDVPHFPASQCDCQPGLVDFYVFFSEDETEVTHIRVHSDAESMEFHMKVLRDNWKETFSRYGDNVEGMKVECFGDTPPRT